MNDLGTVSGGRNSWATDINDFDQIVGAANNDSTSSRYDILLSSTGTRR
jgi:hypothetical protein